MQGTKGGVFVQLEGQIAAVRFYSDETGYFVATLLTEDGDVTLVGTMSGIAEGETVRATGELTFHTRYGEQFKASEIERVRPSSRYAIYAYLASGAIDRIGPAMAERILERFGDRALDVLERDPDRYLEVRGIGKKTLAAITASFREQADSRETMLALQAWGIGPSVAHRIYQRYGAEAIREIRENPYRLAAEVEGIGFRKADEIALALGMPPDSPFRLCAGVQFALEEAAHRDGHVCLPKTQLLRRASDWLGVPEENLSDAIDTMHRAAEVHLETLENETVVYATEVYEIETDAARRVAKIVRAKPEALEAEDLPDFLGEEQREAIHAILTESVCVLTGGPGTGKTTLLNALLQALKENEQKVLLCAPTGRAAKRMEESTKTTATTVHRLLGYNPSQSPPYTHDEDDPLRADWVLVDESSMLDLFLFHRLLCALPSGCRLVLIGDSDQLPSVGAGNVLADLIACRSVPVHRLTRIYRQALESNIVVNAHRMLQGEMPLVNEEGKDFFFMPTRDPEETAELLRSLLVKRLPDAYGVNPVTDIQVLTPVKKQPFGTEALNRLLQEAMNPYVPTKNQVERRDGILREGDKVMQLKNNYDIDVRTPSGSRAQGVFNGDMGCIASIDEEAAVTVRFDDESTATFVKKEQESLGLAYAITIHKSQGSEFPLVVIPLHKGPPMLYTRNLLYTAVTRAKKLVILIGDWQVVRQMIANTHTQRRYGFLGERVDALAGGIGAALCD